MPKTAQPDFTRKDIERLPCRNGYEAGLLELGKKNSCVVVLTGDLSESVKTETFRQAHPDRFVECGVAEQNMMGVAAGLALAGKIPFVSSYAAFSPGRNWDQLRVSVCYSNANVKIVGSHAGLTVGPDGATHQALEDIAMTRALPNLAVIVPCDTEETKKCTIAAANMRGPVYIRFGRSATPVITTKQTPFEIGKHLILREGTDVTIAACGPLVYEALLASDMLAKKRISAEVINCHTIKPFDEKTIVESVAKTGCCVTAEDHQIIGGLFGAVSETLARHLPSPLEPVGMPNCFGESGEPDELLKKYGMKAQDIVEACLAVRERV